MTVRSALLAAAAVATVATGLGAAPAFAADFDDVQHNQLHRIREGVRSGALTRHEAARLAEEQDRISHMIRRARADGRVDAYERGEIGRAQDAASRRIFVEKHDTEQRPHHRRWWHRWSYRG